MQTYSNTSVFKLFRWSLGSTLLFLSFFTSCQCDRKKLPETYVECGTEHQRCLIDEQCIDGQCRAFEKCNRDSDCPTAAYFCSFPSQVCTLRNGFALECSTEKPCIPGEFCALGKCRVPEETRSCSSRSDCPQGQSCDQLHFYCIEDAPCTISETFPEAHCEQDELCDKTNGYCLLQCQEQCTIETSDEDCAVGLKCDNSCRCVQCTNNTDCGAGLICNARAGRCESENLCFDQSDCELPLVCDPQTALCQIPPPPCESEQDCNFSEICNRITGKCELPGGICHDDRFEDSDTPLNAKTLEVALNSQPIILDELQLCPDDNDVYAIELNAGERINIKISKSLNRAKASAWLLDSSAEQSLAFSRMPPFGAGHIQYTAQQNETVFLRLNTLIGATPYALEINKVSDQVCMPDIYEGTIGNNLLSTASPEETLPANLEIDAVLCPNDLDYYQLSILKGELLNLELTPTLISDDLDLKLFDQTTGTLLIQSSSSDYPEKLTYKASKNEQLIVQISAFKSKDGHYKLSAHKEALPICIDDNLEPDNTLENIHIVAQNPNGLDLVNQERSLCGAADVEYYSFSLRDYEQLIVRTSYNDPSFRLNLELFTADNFIQDQTPLLATGQSTPEGKILFYAPNSAQNVILKVSNSFQSEGNYALTIQRKNNSSCPLDLAEPNNEFNQAQNIVTIAQGLTLCDNDEDYYYIDSPAGKELKVRIDFLQQNGDLDLMILGVDGRQILGTSEGLDNFENLQTILPIEGRYFIRIFSLSNQVNNYYNLQYELNSP